jgi:hypothetical protein
MKSVNFTFFHRLDLPFRVSSLFIIMAGKMSQLYAFSRTKGRELQHSSICLFISTIPARSVRFIYVVRTETWAEGKMFHFPVSSFV